MGIVVVTVPGHPLVEKTQGEYMGLGISDIQGFIQSLVSNLPTPVMVTLSPNVQPSSESQSKDRSSICTTLLLHSVMLSYLNPITLLPAIILGSDASIIRKVKGSFIVSVANVNQEGC